MNTIRNSEFLSKEEYEKLIMLKGIISRRCLDVLGVEIPEPLINHICNYIDLTKQYKITPVSSKRFMKKNIYNGYSRELGDNKDIITRYRVTNIAGVIDPGYRRNTRVIYKANVKTDTCVVCMQEFRQGKNGTYVRDVGYHLYIYIRKDDIS